uniref:Protocadherin 1 n=1 Tax=Neogobius melanostomus TaxID=47308 RepID=A0A8C6TIH5_9GOBI
MGGAMAASFFLFLSSILFLSSSSLAAPTDILYRVSEEQPPNTLIGSLLEVGAPYLRVDGKTGDIYTTEIPIDRETLKDCRNVFDGDECFLEFEVSITDMVKGMGSGPRLIEVQVTDINDNAPSFSPVVFEVDFAEENQPGDKVLEVIAADADSGTNAELIYSIVEGTARHLFEIDSASGTVRVKNVLDREDIERYEFRVAAADKGVPSKTGTATVVINVLDRNDNDPKFMLSSYSFSVIENMLPLNPVGVVTLPHRRVTFSTTNNQAQDMQDSSQHSYYDSGLEESETPSSKSSSGPRLGPLALPEDHYERTTPDGSIGEMEHPENGKTRWSFNHDLDPTLWGCTVFSSGLSPYPY